MIHWAEEFEARSADDLLEQLQEDLRERWDALGESFILAMSVIADQLGKKLREERETERRRIIALAREFGTESTTALADLLAGE